MIISVRVGLVVCAFMKGTMATTSAPTGQESTTAESTTAESSSTTESPTSSSTTLVPASENNTIAEIGATTVVLDDGGCLSVCENEVDACANDPRSHGSYCKFWQNPPVCFGMYVQNNQTSSNNSNSTNSTSFCFQPNDQSCDDSALPPLECPIQTNTTCANICSQTPSCVSRGSFCKTDNNVCFGLYWTDSNQSSACFQPNDPSCPTTFPISCQANITGTTTSPATESAVTESATTEVAPTESVLTESTETVTTINPTEIATTLSETSPPA